MCDNVVVAVSCRKESGKLNCEVLGRKKSNGDNKTKGIIIKARI